MGKQWACVPKFGRSLAHQNSEGAAARPIESPAKRGRYRCDQKANENGGILPPKSAKSTTQQSFERRSNDSVWKVKCLEEVGEERLSAQRRVEPQCESHSWQ